MCCWVRADLGGWVWNGRPRPARAGRAGAAAVTPLPHGGQRRGAAAAAAAAATVTHGQHARGRHGAGRPQP